MQGCLVLMQIFDIRRSFSDRVNIRDEIDKVKTDIRINIYISYGNFI